MCAIEINEVLADPGRDWDGDGEANFRADEWVEIVNSGSVTEDLTGYFLADEEGGPVFGFAGTLSPGEVRVVYGSDSTEWESANGESATGLRAGQFGRHRNALEIDGSGQRARRRLCLSRPRSGRRSLVGTESRWVARTGCSSMASTRMRGAKCPMGTGWIPTPGLPNTAQEPTPTLRASWGDVKTSVPLAAGGPVLPGPGRPHTLGRVDHAHLGPGPHGSGYALGPDRPVRGRAESGPSPVPDPFQTQTLRWKFARLSSPPTRRTIAG